MFGRVWTRGSPGYIDCVFSTISWFESLSTQVAVLVTKCAVVPRPELRCVMCWVADFSFAWRMQCSHDDFSGRMLPHRFSLLITTLLLSLCVGPMAAQESSEAEAEKLDQRLLELYQQG